MAIGLNLDYTQRTDATAVIFRDSTGSYSGANVTGWGSPNEAVSDLVIKTTTTVGKYHIYLTISITDSDGTTTAYDAIDLIGVFGTPNTESDLVYPIDCTVLKVATVAIGTATDTVPDGIWDVTYKVVNANNELIVVDTYTEAYLVTGTVEIDVYDNLREITEVYDLTDFDTISYDIRDIINPLYTYAYLQGLWATNFDSKREEAERILGTIESLV